jgi:hypothetical protein
MRAGGCAAPPALLTLPALLMPEVDGSTGLTAKIVTIISAKVREEMLHIEYAIDALIPPIPVNKIVELATVRVRLSQGIRVAEKPSLVPHQ